MTLKNQHQRKTAPAIVVISIVLLSAAVGNPLELMISAVEPNAAELVVLSQWDDEPVEQLKAAPRPKRTAKKYIWEQPHAKADAKGGLAWTPWRCS